MASTQQEANKKGMSNYASVNGLSMYYEVHGSGDPLILIPGGLMTIDMMGQIVPSLATSRQVIAVEVQAHGHTADIDRPWTYEQIADDIAELIVQLGHQPADVFGFSMGSGVALYTAIRHPDKVRKLVFASSAYKSDGEYPEIRAMEASFDADMPILAANRQAYIAAKGTPAGWQALIKKARQVMARDYDLSREVAALQAPTLILVGDADVLPPAHAVEMFELLGGGKVDSAMGNFTRAQLAVLPGTTHFNILNRIDLLLAIVTPFLDAPMPEDT